MSARALSAWTDFFNHCLNCRACMDDQPCPRRDELQGTYRRLRAEIDPDEALEALVNTFPPEDHHERRNKIIRDVAFAICLAIFIAFPALLLVYTYAHR